MATISNTPRPGYVWDSTDNVWYPIGVGGHSHPDYITQATAVNPTIIDAKGDIITATAADTPARLAVGNNGEQIVADSSTATGLRWNPSSVMTNPIINGGMDVWQRGTSISLAASAGTTYLADRWSTQTGASQATTVSRQATGDTTNLPNIQYAMRYQRNSGQTGTSNYAIMSPLETTNTIPFAGKAVTLSFYARKGANYSATSDILRGILRTGTGTDQTPFTGYTGDALTLDANFTLTTTWQRFAVSGTLPTTVTEMTAQFNYTPTGTAGAADYYEITGVQVDLGTYTASTAPAFRRSGGTIQGELAACQRYYIRYGGIQSFQSVGTGFGISATKSWIFVPLTVPMRVIPTSVGFSTLRTSDGTNKTAITAATLVSDENNNVNPVVEVTVTSTQYRSVFLQANSSTSGYLELSAEL